MFGVLGDVQKRGDKRANSRKRPVSSTPYPSATDTCVREVKARNSPTPKKGKTTSNASNRGARATSIATNRFPGRVPMKTLHDVFTIIPSSSNKVPVMPSGRSHSRGGGCTAHSTRLHIDPSSSTTSMATLQSTGVTLAIPVVTLQEPKSL